MNIITGENNVILRNKSIQIERFDKKLKKLVTEMRKTVITANGLGLAAPQVGINKRFFLMKIKNNFLSVINPKILYKSHQKEIGEEGCLSIPGVWGEVERSKEVQVEFQNIKGDTINMVFSGLEARIFQHEYDHLEGELFIDKLELNNTQNQNSVFSSL